MCIFMFVLILRNVRISQNVLQMDSLNNGEFFFSLQWLRILQSVKAVVFSDSTRALTGSFVWRDMMSDVYEILQVLSD